MVRPAKGDFMPIEHEDAAPTPGTLSTPWGESFAVYLRLDGGDRLNVCFKIARPEYITVTQKEFNHSRDADFDPEAHGLRSALFRRSADWLLGVALKPTDTNDEYQNRPEWVKRLQLHRAGDHYYAVSESNATVESISLLMGTSPCVHCGKTYELHAGTSCIFGPTKFEAAPNSSLGWARKLSVALAIPPSPEVTYLHWVGQDGGYRQQVGSKRKDVFRARTGWRLATLQRWGHTLSINMAKVGTRHGYPANFMSRGPNYTDSIQVELTPDVIAFARRVCELVDGQPASELRKSVPEHPRAIEFRADRLSLEKLPDLKIVPDHPYDFRKKVRALLGST